MQGQAHEPARTHPRVALVTGRGREGHNAINDYAALLCEGLRGRHFPAVHIQHQDWGIRGLRVLLGELDRLQPDLVHVQHPQSIYGSSLAPQLLTVIRPAVTTMHEASRYGPVLGRARLLPFLLRSRRVVVTSEFERKYVAGFAPWARNRIEVIPLASNIPMRSGAAGPRPQRLVYFGHLRPGKGLETFLRVATVMAEATPGLECLVIGSPVFNSTGYARRLQADLAATPIRWLTGLSAEAVSDELGRARVAYLPFPDGASERRGSLLASLGCGVPTVTTAGPHTTPDLRTSVEIAANADEAISRIRRLLADESHWTAMSERSRAYAEQFTWDEVIRQHIALYQSAISPR